MRIMMSKGERVMGSIMNTGFGSISVCIGEAYADYGMS